MGDKSKIEWTEATWTPIRARLKSDPTKVGWHCEHDSEGCRFCYAESLNKRLGTGLDFKPGHRKDVEMFLDEKMLLAPLRWRRPRMIFVCSMTDLFAEFVPDEWIDALFAVMMLCPQHTFQVLTKRMKRARAYCSDPATAKRISDKVCDMALERDGDLGCGMVLIAPGIDPELAPKGTRVFLGRWPLPNVWLGCSAEDQENADARVPELLATPAAVRFVSAEPLLGPIDFTDHGGKPEAHGWSSIWTGNSIGRRWLDWIIVGGESGREARPMHPDWARSIRDQCAAAGVPYFFKQFGEFGPSADIGDQPGKSTQTFATERVIKTFGGDIQCGIQMVRVGKKAAGRLLDGREHNEIPRPRV